MRGAPKIIAKYLENFTTNDVYDILKDMGLDITEHNQRAVRILAYNQTEITVENIPNTGNRYPSPDSPKQEKSKEIHKETNIHQTNKN